MTLIQIDADRWVNAEYVLAIVRNKDKNGDTSYTLTLAHDAAEAGARYADVKGEYANKLVPFLERKQDSSATAGFQQQRMAHNMKNPEKT